LISRGFDDNRDHPALASQAMLIDKLNRSKKSFGFLRGHQSTEFFKAMRATACLGTGGKHSLRGKNIGFVFQTFNLIPALTAAQTVATAGFSGLAGRDRIFVDGQIRWRHKHTAFVLSLVRAS
jgi:ABC-type phosphate/phosphonate transport system ATPase subunit